MRGERPGPRPPSAPPPPPGRLRYHFVRLGLRTLLGCYIRVRVEGVEHLPDEPYIVCFNHPSWTDPLVLAGFWPDRRQLFIMGPRELDMSVGWRNRVIAWSRRGVPFKPLGADLLDATRRAVAVLRRGGVLAIAGEGRLSDDEHDPLPLQDGVAVFAVRAGVPVVPLAIVGTRWVHFGKRVRLRFGPPVLPPARGGRERTAAFTAQLDAGLRALLLPRLPEHQPGPIGRWLSELFNDRPWLGATGAAPPGERR